MRILFVVNRLRKRGAEQQLFNFVRELPDHVDVTIFRFSCNDDDFLSFSQLDKVTMYSNKFFGPYNLLKFWPLYNCLSKQHYDVVITIGVGASLFFGRICGSLSGVRIVYSILSTFENFNRILKFKNDFFDILNGLLNTLLPYLRKNRIYRFLPNSDDLAEKIKSSTNSYQIQVLYNGIPKNDFQRLNIHIPHERTITLLSQIEDYPTVTQVGALDHNKNQLFTLHCINEMKNLIPDIRFLIIGEGYNKSELIRYTISNDLEKQVIFAGQMDRMECLYLMSKSSLLVLTSHGEAFPNVLLEAQALSLPVVTFNVGAASEIIAHNVTGFVVEPADRKGFIHSVIKLLTDNDLAKRMGERGKKRTFDTFCMGNKVSRFLSMVEKDSYFIKESNQK